MWPENKLGDFTYPIGGQQVYYYYFSEFLNENTVPEFKEPAIGIWDAALKSFFSYQNILGIKNLKILSWNPFNI